MLKRVLKDKILSRNLSVRAAATEIGVSHTTLHRIMDDGNADLDTITRIADWAGLSLGELLGVDSAEETNALVSSIPGLREVLRDAAEKVKSGDLTPSDLEDITAYAKFRIGEKYERKKKDLGG